MLNLILLVTPLLYAEAPANSSLLVNKPEQLLVNEILELRPVAGHHFNLKAPQRCGTEDFTERSPRRLSCEVTRPGMLPVAASVCTDDEKHCITETFNVQVSAPAGWKESQNTETGPKVQRYLPKRHLRTAKGFISNDPQKAVALAKSQNKLLLVEVSTEWCPPCNHLMETVLETPEFQKASANFVRLSLDGDSQISWDWKDRFKVNSYPTILIINPQLEEVDRLIGYRPTQVFVQWLNSAPTIQPIQKTVEALKGKDIANRDEANFRVGRWHYQRHELKEAVPYLKASHLSEARKYFLYAQDDLAEKQDDVPGRVHAILALLKEFPDAIEYADWISELKDLDSEALTPQLLSQAKVNLEKWTKRDPLEIEAQDKDLGEIIGDQGSIAELQQRPDEAKTFYLKAADYYKEAAKTSKLKVPRAANMERMYWLLQAKDYKALSVLGKQMTKAYPEEATFNLRYARALYELKRYDEAYPYAKAAEANSFGSNWFFSVEVLAKIQIARHKNAEAKQIIEKALSEVVIPKSTNLYIQELVSQLRKLSDEASGKKS